MGRRYSKTIKIAALITLLAFSFTQAACGYDDFLCTEQSRQAAKAAGDELASAMGAVNNPPVTETELGQEINIFSPDVSDKFKRVALGITYIRHELSVSLTPIKGHLLGMLDDLDEMPDFIRGRIVCYNETLVKLIDNISVLFNDIYNRELIDNFISLRTELERLGTDEEFISTLRTSDQQLIAEALSESCVRAIAILDKFIPYVENNDFSLDLEDVDINKFLGRIAEYRMRNVRYELDFDSQGPVVRTDERLLWIVIDNLRRNAIEALDSYCATNGDSAIRERFKFVIATRIEGDKLLISFRDTGLGIKKDDIQHIFELFWTKDKIAWPFSFDIK